MAVTKKPASAQLLAESLNHLERLVNLMLEWQTDWSAISQTFQSGKPNPDFDPSYIATLRDTPDKVYDPAVLAAREFLKKVRPS